MDILHFLLGYAVLRWCQVSSSIAIFARKSSLTDYIDLFETKIKIDCPLYLNIVFPNDVNFPAVLPFAQRIFWKIILIYVRWKKNYAANIWY